MYGRRMIEELDDDWEAESDVWPTLEYGYDGDSRWYGGFRVREDEATVWAIRAVGRTPAAAVQAMLDELA